MRGNRPSILAAMVVAAAALALVPVQRPAAAAEPIKIAVFDFELNDASGGSGIIPQDATDTEYLKQAAEQARRMLAASGRYSIVDASGVGSDTKWGLHNCNGCEAAMASKLGADQSMVGVVTRVSRIVYAVQVVIRDTKTGALVSNNFTGGRMGANYAWPHGVKWLMTNQILPPERAAPSSK